MEDIKKNDNFDQEDYNIREESSLHHYRTEIPNIILDIGLSLEEIGVYNHLKRIAGDRGLCFCSVSSLCKKMNISKPTFLKIRDSLLKKNLIRMQQRIQDKQYTTTVITIVDLWPENMKHFSSNKNQRGGGKKILPGVVKNFDQGGKKILPKEEPIKEDPKEEKKRIRATGEKFQQVRERVKITEKQLQTLKKKYSQEDIEWMFDKLNKWKTDKDQECTSDYGAMNSWVTKALRNHKNKIAIDSKAKETNVSMAKRLISYLERINERGNLKILEDEVFDSVLSKSCSLTHPSFNAIVPSWYGLEWREK